MNAFLVLSTDPSRAGPLSIPEENVTNVIRDTYRLSDLALLVLCRDFVTSKNVASIYGFNEHQQYSGVVVKIDGYAGWEAGDLWEKLREWQRAS